MGLYLLDSILTGSNDKTPKWIKTPADPLAINCALRRGSTHYYSAESYGMIAASQVLEEDVELASSIRDYYSKKLMVQTLAGYKLSGYRSDLKEFLSDPQCGFNPNHFGIISTLYDFYCYDISLDRIYSEHINRDINTYTPRAGEEYRLKPVGLLKRKTRTAKLNMYWFKSADTGVAVILPVRTDVGSAALVDIWDRLYHSAGELGITGDWRFETMHGKSYLAARKWRLADGLKTGDSV